MKILTLGIVLRLVVIGAIIGCGGNIASTTEANVENAARLTAASYAHQDAGTAGAALIKEAHCDIQKVIADQKFAALDSGIGCQ